MVNQQLADYIKQQLQGGVAKDAVKKALLDAGWPAQDVDDSMGSAGSAASPVKETINPAVAMGGNDTKNVAAVAPAAGSKFFADTPGAEKSGGSKLPIIILSAVIVILLGALGYVYWSFSNRAPAATPEAAANPSADTQALDAQIQQLTSDKTALTSQVAALTSTNQGLTDEFNFFSGSGEITVTGKVSVTSGTYYVTTPHNIVVSIKNSKDTKVIADLKSLVGQTAMVKGTRTAGTLTLTMTSVSVPAPAQPAATSTATSTASAAGTTPTGNSPATVPVPPTSTAPAATSGPGAAPMAPTTPPPTSTATSTP